MNEEDKLNNNNEEKVKENGTVKDTEKSTTGNTAGDNTASGLGSKPTRKPKKYKQRGYGGRRIRSRRKSTDLLAKDLLELSEVCSPELRDTSGTMQSGSSELRVPIRSSDRKASKEACQEQEEKEESEEAARINARWRGTRITDT